MIAAHILWRKAHRFVIARPQRGRGNLVQAAAISPMAFQRSNKVLRDSHVASLHGMPNLKVLRRWITAAISATASGAHRAQRARCIRFLQKSSKNHDFHLADFACVWYIFILWTKNLLGNTAQLQLRPSPDIFRRSIGLKSLRYTKYICTFQTLSRQKISRRMLLLNHALLP